MDIIGKSLLEKIDDEIFFIKDKLEDITENIYVMSKKLSINQLENILKNISDIEKNINEVYLETGIDIEKLNDITMVLSGCRNEYKYMDRYTINKLNSKKGNIIPNMYISKLNNENIFNLNIPQLIEIKGASERVGFNTKLVNMLLNEKKKR
jgi:hypothetical protein